MSRPFRSPEEIDQLLAAGLYRLRRSYGLTQSEIAKILGVRYQQVAKYETGRNRLAARQLLLLTRAFNITVDQFLRDETAEWRAACAAALSRLKAPPANVV